MDVRKTLGKRQTYQVFPKQSNGVQKFACVGEIPTFSNHFSFGTAAALARHITQVYHIKQVYNDLSEQQMQRAAKLQAMRLSSNNGHKKETLRISFLAVSSSSLLNATQHNLHNWSL